jgi:short-subunit dehydrogenase
MGKSGKTALITGASAGIGRELARLAARDGHDVVLVARRKDRLEELARELEATHGVVATVLEADLGDRGAPQVIAQKLQSAGRSVDFLINNAGFGSHGAFVETDFARQAEMVDVNIRALMELTYRLLPQMLERHAGRILNVASLAGFVPGPFMATYYASKAFVLSFSEALSAELHGTGITVTAACPGPVATEFGTVANTERTNLFRSGAASATSVAENAYQAMLAGKVVSIPGFKNKLTAFSIRLGPRALVRRIAAWMNQKPKHQGA